METSRIIIAGGRDFCDAEVAWRHIENFLKVFDGQRVVIVSGGARGADRLGEQYAQQKGIDLDVKTPDWKRYGKSAGIVRNIEMAIGATALLAFWDGKSRGTKHMIEIAKRHDLTCEIVLY